MKDILRSPTLHFFVIALLTWLLYETRVPAPGPARDNTIVVNRDSLLTYLSYKQRRFGDGNAETTLDSLGKQELGSLVDSYLREEVYYRQAMQLEMDIHDEVIRQRLVQKVRFINRSMISDSVAVTEDELQRYFEANPQKYIEPAVITMSHVYLNENGVAPDKTRSRATDMLGQLNSGQVPVSRGPGYGDRFLYRTNYVNSTHAELLGHFGEDMATVLFELQPDDQKWQGPLRSDHGLHLVMLLRKLPARVPQLDEVRERVMVDLRKAMTDAREQEIFRELLSGYNVEIDL